MKPNGELLGLSIFSTAILLAAVIFLTSVIPDFAGIFESFRNRDNDLPLFTKMVLSTYKSWWLFPLASFLLGIVAYKRKSISAKHQKALKVIFWGGIVLALMLVFFTVQAMYAPIFIWADGNA